MVLEELHTMTRSCQDTLVAQGPPSPRISGNAEPALAEPTDTKGLGTTGNQAPKQSKALRTRKTKSFGSISISALEKKSKQVRNLYSLPGLEMFGSADCPFFASCMFTRGKSPVCSMLLQCSNILNSCTILLRLTVLAGRKGR